MTSKQSIVISDASVAVTGGLRNAASIALLLEDVADVHLVLPEGADIPARELIRFASVSSVPVAKAQRKVGAVLAYPLRSYRAGKALLKILRERRADALIINDYPTLQGWFARRLGFRGRVLTWLRFDPRRFPGPLSSMWLGAARDASDQIVAVSRFIQNQLPDGFKTEFLYDCIDPTLAPRPRGTSGERQIICVGNYIPGKGQDDVVEVFAKVAGHHPLVALHFWGGDMGLAKNAVYRRDLEKMAAATSVGDRIIFHGFGEDLPSIYADAVVALNLSRSEALSGTCIEAAQLGVPVIAYRSGGPEEIIDDGETGFLCPLGDVQAVADRLSQILEDRTSAERLGAAARKLAMDRFGIETSRATLRRLLAL